MLCYHLVKLNGKIAAYILMIKFIVNKIQRNNYYNNLEINYFKYWNKLLFL